MILTVTPDSKTYSRRWIVSSAAILAATWFSALTFAD
jgi:hypothetical protein